MPRRLDLSSPPQMPVLPSVETVAESIAMNYVDLDPKSHTFLEDISEACTARDLSTKRRQSLISCEDRVSRLSTFFGIPNVKTSSKNTGVSREVRYELLRTGYLLFRTLYPKILSGQEPPRPKLIPEPRDEPETGSNLPPEPATKTKEDSVPISKWKNFPEVDMTLLVWKGVAFGPDEFLAGAEGRALYLKYYIEGNHKFQKTKSPRPDHLPTAEDLSE